MCTEGTDKISKKRRRSCGITARGVRESAGARLADAIPPWRCDVLAVRSPSPRPVRRSLPCRGLPWRLTTTARGGRTSGIFPWPIGGSRGSQPAGGPIASVRGQGNNDRRPSRAPRPSVPGREHGEFRKKEDPMKRVLQSARSADPGALSWRPAWPLWRVRPSAHGRGPSEGLPRAVAVDREPRRPPHRRGGTHGLLGGPHVVIC